MQQSSRSSFTNSIPHFDVWHFVFCEAQKSVLEILQAMDRVYRIGQTRDVKVVRFICAKSIEERILELQESKTLLGLAALNQVCMSGKKRRACLSLRFPKGGQRGKAWGEMGRGWKENRRPLQTHTVIVHTLCWCVRENLTQQT